MKKILFLIPAFLLTFQISKAQTEKGSQTLGINLALGYSKQSNPNLNGNSNAFTNTELKYLNYTIGPTYSYFIADKLDIGGSLFYSNNRSDYADNSTERYHSYGASVTLRKYLMFNQYLGFRAGPQLSYARSVQNTNGGIYSSDGTTNSYTGGVNLGFVYYPIKRMGLSAILASLNYNHSSTLYSNGLHGKTDNLNFAWVSNNLGLSAFYIFGGK
ncbi:hypothetical protein [Mucilaginibacter dorajii]|nr:hypothetical protein [Mucilaginibacter dorajii]MCS3736793.1 outer membrane protein assembly factor BamA [Mucilaginibacter dorajii]